ncbi:voltage-dependent calcium channel subunit alpha-2/delta-3 isoform X6 [Linepithema humile]|uniref:voltage-dependent calcium channel subunit alpha-2/delta-3 isoform X6 n=1 Tax=Linepithema humile TaxID=83485 RepID=UPI00351E0D7A
MFPRIDDRFLHFGILCLLWIGSSSQQEEDIPHNEVKNWALKFGVDLWEFGKQATKMGEIQRKYHDVESNIAKKDGLVLVREMAAEVKNMMDFKMNAVMRLVESAEQAAVAAPREGNVSPKYYASHRLHNLVSDEKGSAGTQEMFLAANRHFDHLAVNVTLSAVLLPSGIKDNERDVASGIQWSEYLDLLFVNNYESDPTLSWQYYGATTGFLRRFPGFYARITNVDDIHDKVFEYVKVLARPMVLYQHDHPIHWSPAYVGGKSSRYGRENRGQLMTSVTAPILDRRNHTVKTANLLGIVGTDVPVEEIQKLVPPYKLGVNGYSFIVDNNGRVLYHPDLRPLPGNTEYEETLKPSYISVDLSEVELAEYDGPSIPPNNSLLLDLRRDMIDQKEGETDFTIKMHYDDMKRVTIRRHNYFYKPIDGTPFSLGLALPEGYGLFELRAEQEIKLAIVNVTDYFKGNNWKVHPDWIYCEYSSASDKFFSSPEERVLHFLLRTRRPGWKWMSLRPRSPSSHHKQASKSDKDAYYCDKKLVQSLVLDALVTDGFDKREAQRMHKEENENPIAILMALLHSQGKGRFGVTRSFIATRSGLLRWHEHQQSDETIDEPRFAEKHARAMDSSWYKRAVDQHSIEPESFVFSVPFDAADTADPLVTATHAVFVGKNHKAPAAVVGLQFQHSSLATHFVNITSTCTGMAGCKKNCASEELDCYILDNNGFIIISERHEHTGKFFGEIDGTIMDSLVQDRIYRKVTVIDYQGTCSPQESHQSSAPQFLSNSIIKTVATFGNFLWTLALSLNIQDLWRTTLAFAGDTMYSLNDNLIVTDDGEIHDYESLTSADSTEEATLDENNVYVRFPAIAPALPASPPTTRATSAHYPRKLRSCEKKTDLYILQPERLNTSGQSNPLKGKLTNCHVTGCERPFSVQKIRHTNLILLVVDTLCPCGSKQLSIEPIEALTEPGACIARRERLYRRRPPKCINYHPEEMEIKFCGNADRLFSSTFSSLNFMVFLSIVTVWFA